MSTLATNLRTRHLGRRVILSDNDGDTIATGTVVPARSFAGDKFIQFNIQGSRGLMGVFKNDRVSFL